MMLLVAVMLRVGSNAHNNISDWDDPEALKAPKACLFALQLYLEDLRRQNVVFKETQRLGI
jgi:hypothetical protein